MGFGSLPGKNETGAEIGIRHEKFTGRKAGCFSLNPGKIREAPRRWYFP